MGSVVAHEGAHVGILLFGLIAAGVATLVAWYNNR
jgi:hypothetical protein